MRYIDRLIINCEKAKAAKPLREFEMNDLSQLIGISKAIYIIEQIGGTPEETFLEFCRFKQGQTRSCARANAPSQILYVGSSTTGLRNRIRSHQGLGHKGTYSLQLSHWFNGQHKITIREYDVSREVLQIVEDDLADTLKPAFGKPGANGR